MNPTDYSNVYISLLEDTGFDHVGGAAKIDLDVAYKLTDHLYLTGGIYYLHHFNVKHNTQTFPSKPYHSEYPLDFTNDPPTFTSNQPYETLGLGTSLSSVGLHIGLKYTFSIW